MKLPLNYHNHIFKYIIEHELSIENVDVSEEENILDLLNMFLIKNSFDKKLIVTNCNLYIGVSFTLEPKTPMSQESFLKAASEFQNIFREV